MGAGNEMNSSPDQVEFSTALDHAWNWFALHSDHRMRAVNFYILSVSFLTAAYVTALRYGYAGTAIFVAVAGFALSILFFGLELRIKELIKAGEAALRPLQDRIASAFDIQDCKLVEHVEDSDHVLTKYSTVISALHIVAALLFFIGGIYAAVSVARSFH